MYKESFSPTRHRTPAFLEKMDHGGGFLVICKGFNEAGREIVKIPLIKKPLPRKEALAVKRKINWPHLQLGE